ncbi:hypothetical protein ACQE3D_13445 [Methylomonas sp. MS20]|uniref:hypothetical protein n=1 Tax=unclassified Methylomonas TaxID=2608980 RepID=UPI0028A55C9F|nr:hypothetical protein [Methylomonas sp. MV1]MDT4331628.1 hypothetical protein [Methylomonas sp. MV1]
MNAGVLCCTLPLPTNYRLQDILSFHARDALAVAETVQANQLRKGIVWHGSPACLTLRFLPMAAEIELSIDYSPATLMLDELSALAARMLGLNQPVELVMLRALLAVPEFERTSIFISITVLFRSAVGK